MKEYILRFNKPSRLDRVGWEKESLPIGNGFSGMKIFGGVATERLQFNDKTLWKGGPSKTRPNYNGGNIDGKYNDLLKIQKALDDKDYKKAKELRNNLIGLQEGYGGYLPYANLMIEFNHENISSYERGLNLNGSIAYVKYEADGIKHEREFFASIEDRCIVSTIKASAKSNLKLYIKSDLQGSKIEYKKDEIILTGEVIDNGLKYETRALVDSDGVISQTADGLVILGYTKVDIYMFMDTDYLNKYPTYRGEDPSIKIENYIKKLDKDSIKQRHITYSRNQFERQSISISNSTSSLYTNELLAKYKKNKATQEEKRELEELVFFYGKYLIMASSQKGSLPANLQGVWNDIEDPAWQSDYHLNVNLQMCYWHVYQSGLFEAAIPLLDYIDSLIEPGRVTAKTYNNINKWVAHNQNTPFGWTCPGWVFDWGWSPASSSWILQNTYDYYLYTKDINVLKEKIYPAMKENAEFWLENLKYDKDQNRYVSYPTFSPEQGPITKGNTYEQEIIYALFDRVIDAATILNDDKAFIDKVKEYKEKLKPLAIGYWNQIKEWFEEDDWKHSNNAFIRRLIYKKHNSEFHHRHASHLLAVYPFYDINEEKQDLFNAAKVSLIHRGFDGASNPGWSKANKALLYSRLKLADYAYKTIESLIQNNLYDNLWDFHPPYQMDGNCGYSAAVMEMLVYDDGKVVELLPALPKDWIDGEVKGFFLKGNMTIDFKWKDGKIIEYVLHNNKDKVTLKINKELVQV